MLFLIALGLSCQKENSCDCFKSTGGNVREIRTVGNFNYIKVYDNINLYITQDTLNSVIVEAGNTLLKNISTDVVGNALIIHNNNKCNWVRSFKRKINVYVSFKLLTWIVCETSETITSTNTIIAPDTFRFDALISSPSVNLKLETKSSAFRFQPGSQDLTVTGKTIDNYIYTFGQSLVDFRNFTSENTLINIRGDMPVYFYSSKAIYGDFVGNGNVYYYGNPAIVDIKHTSGKGKFIKEN